MRVRVMFFIARLMLPTPLSIVFAFWKITIIRLWLGSRWLLMSKTG